MGWLLIVRRIGDLSLKVSQKVHSSIIITASVQHDILWKTMYRMIVLCHTKGSCPGYARCVVDLGLALG